MKRFSLIAVTLGVVFLLAAILPAAASSRHPFRGKWEGIDAFDDSNITLKIVEESRSGGQVFSIRARDDRTGDWCSGNGPAEMTAVGVLRGEDTIVVSLIWWCLPPGEGLYPYPDSDPALDPDVYTYDSSNDTITDRWETVYHRVR
jgi:hypothetical protein